MGLEFGDVTIMVECSEGYTILVFDDQRDRKGHYELLARELHCHVEFVDLQEKDVFAEINRVKDRLRPPALVLVDHILNRTSGDSRKVSQKGSTVASLVREEWPRCPILAITAAFDECKRDILSEIYEEVFRFEELSNLEKLIPQIIAGYRQMDQEALNVERLLALLDAPTDERAPVLCTLPACIKDPCDPVHCMHHVYRWFRTSFYANPGFLYDERWASVMIGVDKAYFSCYVSALAPAAYRGIFGDPNAPRWWRSRLLHSVLPVSRERFTISVQEAAARALNVPREHFSRCYKCHDHWPEIMACVDELSLSPAEQQPMHLRCTRPHAHAPAMPFYEDLRVMLEDD